MKTFAALSLTAALLGATAVSLAPSTAQAAPVGAMAGVFDAGAPAVDSVRYRGRGMRQHGGKGAALAVGMIGAAVLGGALIAESWRGERAEARAYYDDDDCYGDGYYFEPAYVAPRRRYVEPGYYASPVYGYHPRHHHHRPRLMRDPAGGGLMRLP